MAPTESEKSLHSPTFGDNKTQGFFPEEHKFKVMNFRKSKMRDKLGTIASGNPYNVLVSVVHPEASQ